MSINPTDPPGTRTPPQDLEAERGALGGMLLSADAIDDVAAIIATGDFYRPAHEAIFDAIIWQQQHDEPTDIIGVSARLRATSDLTRIGGDLYLHRLINETPTAANAGWYASRVHKIAVLRHIIEAGTRITQLGYGADPNACDELVQAARNEVDAVARGRTAPLTAKTLGEILDGPDAYDWLIPGFLERRDRLVLTGTEGGGKTTFMRQVAICASAGVHPLRFTPIDPLRVLVVDAENTEVQWRRKSRAVAVAARLRGTADPNQTLHIAAVDTMEAGRLNLTSARDVVTIHRLIDQYQPDILMIGPLYKLVPGALNSDDDAAPLFTALDGFRGRGLTLLMEAHAGHAMGADGQRDPRPRGSSALLGWPEFGFGLRANHEALADPSLTPEERNHPRIFDLVRWRGDRDEREWPAQLMRGGEWPWQAVPAPKPGWTPTRAVGQKPPSRNWADREDAPPWA